MREYTTSSSLCKFFHQVLQTSGWVDAKAKKQKTFTQTQNCTLPEQLEQIVLPNGGLHKNNQCLKIFRTTSVAFESRRTHKKKCQV